MSSLSLTRTLNAAGYQVDAAAAGRVALGGAYRTAEGQWVVEGGEARWVGGGTPTDPPPSALVARIETAVAAHVPPPPPVQVNRTTLLRALAKACNGTPLSQAESDAITQAEQL